MANLDPRLLPLFETLVAADADWLVFELVEGIGAGVVVEESSEALATARLLVRWDRVPQRTRGRTPISTQSQPLSGDEQIFWTAQYVGTRLKNALDMMETSIDRLDRLVNDPWKEGGVGARSGVTISLQDSEGTESIAIKNRSAAQLAIQDLLAGLQRWVLDVTERPLSL